MFMTAMIVLQMWKASSELVLVEAGQTSAPVCLYTSDCEVVQ